MKCIFAFLLLHLCCNIGLSTNVYQEIIGNLTELKRLSKEKKVITTPPDVVDKLNITNVSSCVGVFTKELTRLLNNVTLNDRENKDLPIKLQANLRRLEELHSREPQQQNDQRCKTGQQQKFSTAILSYLHFAKKLNNSRKK